MSEGINNRVIELMCGLSMVTLTAATYFTDKVPLHLNLAVFSIAIIVIGSYRSLYEIIAEIKKVQLTGKNE